MSYKGLAEGQPDHAHLFYQCIEIVCDIPDRQLKREHLHERVNHHRYCWLACSCLFPQRSAFGYSILLTNDPRNLFSLVSMHLMYMLRTNYKLDQFVNSPLVYKLLSSYKLLSIIQSKVVSSRNRAEWFTSSLNDMKAVQACRTKQPMAPTVWKLAKLFTKTCTNKQSSLANRTVQSSQHRSNNPCWC